ncbi:MAG: hypothetical protein JXR70_09795 [Spirochaetales bacterium]|nr:hypothetical protein [Spirochaetales bacterium]
MDDLGYKEGENISYDIKESVIDFANYKKILDQFVADKVDMIFTFPTEPTIEAKKAVTGTDIPVVFAFAAVDAGSIPVVTSELVIEIHTRAAETLGVEIPKSLMLQATNVLH